MDQELVAIAANNAAIIARLNLIQRDDGALRNGAVGADQIAGPPLKSDIIMFDITAKF